MLENYYLKDMLFENDTMFILLKSRNYVEKAKDFINDNNVESVNETTNLDTSKIESDNNDYYNSVNYDYVSNLLSEDSGFNNKITKL